jgi:hypothetical protein
MCKNMMVVLIFYWGPTISCGLVLSCHCGPQEKGPISKEERIRFHLRYTNSKYIFSQALQEIIERQAFDYLNGTS